MKSGKPAAGGWISAALGAAFLASPLFALDSATSGNWDDGATWAGGLPPGAGDDVVITGACTVTLTGTLERVARNLTVQAGGQLTHAGHSTLDTEARHKLRVTVLQDLTVEAGGSIHADGKGFAQLKGPGPARHGSGAGHGGVGGSRNRPAGGGRLTDRSSPRSTWAAAAITWASMGAGP